MKTTNAKKAAALLLCAALLGSLTACGGKADDGSDGSYADGSSYWADGDASSSGTALPITEDSSEDVLSGGWEINEGALSISENADAQAAFDSAIATRIDTDNDYEAVALLETQVEESGTNYCVLAKVLPDDTGDVAASYALVYIYDLGGNDWMIGTCDLSEALGIDTAVVGGYVFNQRDTALDAEENAEVKAAFDAAVAKQSGKTYTPAAYLASQTVSGTNYCILCRTESAGEDAAATLSLVYIYEDLDGNAEITEVTALDTSNLMIESSFVDDSAEGDYAEADGTEIGDPFTEVDSMEQAAELAGFDMTVPDAPEDYPSTVIRVMEGELIEVLYVNDENEETEGSDEGYRIRKGTGEDDISGDYEEYENTAEQDMGDFTVTLKGNGDSWSVAVWTLDSYAYAVDAEDHPLSTEEMTALVQATK